MVGVDGNPRNLQAKIQMSRRARPERGGFEVLSLAKNLVPFERLFSCSRSARHSIGGVMPIPWIAIHGYPLAVPLGLIKCLRL